MTVVYTSSTKQIENPHAWRCFSALVVAANGDCFTVETRGLRATKAKGLVVRYPNPFAKNAGPAELLYSSSDALNALWCHPSGALHVVGKRYHTNASGTWKASKLADELRHVWGTGDTLWAASPEKLWRHTGTWSEVTCPRDGNYVAIAGTSPTDVYVADEDGALLRFDGKSWKRVAGAPRDARLVSTADGVLATGIARAKASDSNDADCILHRITAGAVEVLLRRKGTGIEPGATQPVCEALGSIFVGGIGTAPHQQVGRVAKGTVEPIANVTIGYADLIGGTKDVLWIHNGIELLAWNGKSWKQVRRILD